MDPAKRLGYRIAHVGIIPDGGRRWASQHGCTLREAYQVSMVKLTDLTSALFERGVMSISIYLLSKKNLRRSEGELTAVAEAESSLFRDLLPKIRGPLDFDVRLAGLWQLAPEPLRSTLASMPQPERRPQRRTLTLLVAYDPFDELLSVVHSMNITTSVEALLEKMWVTTPVDLIIRTGGAATLSDFLPLQSSYARLVFLEKLFNELTVSEAIELIDQHELVVPKFGE